MDTEQTVSNDSDTENTADADRVWDVDYKSGRGAEYECLDCGVIVRGDTHPMTCPTCDAALRNRSMPLE